MKDLSEAPSMFRFDETTASQIKTQYDEYIQYRSPKLGKLLSTYVASLHLSHSNHQQLVVLN